MKLSTLKPLHGWRAFFGEVGVVVLGVLLALGAQQFAQEMQVRADVREFRRTIDREVGMNVYALDLRASQFGCDRQKVAELNRWLDKSRTAPSAPAIYPRGPFVSSPYLSAWNSRDAETYRKLPADVRQKYAMFYDDVDNEYDLIKLELNAWSSLTAFSEPGPMTLEDRRKARPPIALIDWFVRIEQENIASTKQIARELGVKSVTPEDLPRDMVKPYLVCRSIFEPTPALAPSKS
jgi:hypothetical protein